MNPKLKQIDDILADIEDYTHGEEGEKVTKARKILNENQFFTREEMEKSFEAGKEYWAWVRTDESMLHKPIDFETFMQLNYIEK